MIRKFYEYVEEKKSNGDQAVTSRITLGDNNNFQPFLVSDDPNSAGYGKNKSLAPLIRAFKKGGNWGWSKEENSGEDKPMKIGSKRLFLTGGALRDHLVGKKSRNMELVTNASADEVYHILTQNNFDFIGEEGHLDPAMQGSGKNVFWVKKKTAKGRPYLFGVQVKNDEFELGLFKKSAGGGAEVEGGSQTDDAAGRDFTINSMYLSLANDNGPNKELFDFYGGAHHLLNKQILPVGDLGTKLTEDPMRVLRYARMLSRYGDSSKLSDQEKEVIRGASQQLAGLDPKEVAEEFFKGLNHDDGDTRSYLKLYGDLGLLGTVFPNLHVDLKMPKELREIGDKHAPIAWMLRHHQPNEVEMALGGHWKPEVLNKIMFLIKSLKIDPMMDDSALDDMVQNYMTSGVSSRMLKQWATRLGGKQEALLDAFLSHAQSPRVRIHNNASEGDDVDAEFQNFKDPFSGDLRREAADNHRRRLEWDNFQKHLRFHMPVRN
jgi:tRNA nucleotidyltransferase/poly(A) polymerase